MDVVVIGKEKYYNQKREIVFTIETIIIELINKPFQELKMQRYSDMLNTSLENYQKTPFYCPPNTETEMFDKMKL